MLPTSSTLLSTPSSLLSCCPLCWWRSFCLSALLTTAGITGLCMAQVSDWQNSVYPSRPKWNLISVTRLKAFYETPSWVLGCGPLIWMIQRPCTEGLHSPVGGRHPCVACAGTGHWVALTGGTPGTCSYHPSCLSVLPPRRPPSCWALTSGTEMGLVHIDTLSI